MKTYFKFTSFVFLIIVCFAGTAPGQGFIAYHSGYNNPTSEGWTGDTDFGSPQTGAVTNNLGVNAWSILLSSAGGGYFKAVNGLSGLSWILSINLRLDTPGMPTGSAFATTISTGPTGFEMFFGSDTNGNPIVQVVGSNQSPLISLNGGSTYNSYQLIYNASVNQASLWVNGAEQYSSISGFSFASQPVLSWGGDNQTITSYQANWNLVSLQIVPEPSAWALAGIGGLLLAARHRFL